MTPNKTHGGKRANSGRKKLAPSKKSKLTTKAIRVQISLADRIKHGEYEALLHLLYDWKAEVDDASSTSPRYEKLREFFNEAQEILPSNEENWLP